MKRLRALAAILLITTICCAFVSCRGGETEEPSYFASFSPTRALTSKLEVSIGEYDFAEFLNRGMILIEQSTEGDSRFGVTDRDGNLVIEPIWSDLTMVGDFFLAEGDAEHGYYVVLNRRGEILHTSDDALEITDVGGGCVAIEEGSVTYLYSEDGTDRLAATSLDSTYGYTICDDFILASSSRHGDLFLFRYSTGDLLLSRYGSDDTTYAGYYLGGNDFLVVKEQTVGSTGEYTYSIKRNGEMQYVRQTVEIHTIGVSTPRTLEIGKAICTLTDRYAVGVTQEARESYPLNKGYYDLSYYVLDGKSADGTLVHCLTDSELREIGRLPEGISPLLRMIDGVATAEGASGTVYVVNDRLETLSVIKDSRYRSATYTGSLVIASDLSSGGKRGCITTTGEVVVPFEYSYISDFFGSKAIASKEGTTYLLDRDGSVTPLAEESYPYYWHGFYERSEGGKVGLITFDGEALVPARYDEIEGIRRYDNEIYVAMRSGAAVTVFRLF